jgi:trk system potassium uptake protein TrkA
MDILIGGAGKVGYNLAKILSSNHNVTIIDNNQKALEKLQETLDVMTIYGSIVEHKTFIGLEKFDIFIAVTNNDEINLIATLIIDSLELSNKNIVRLSNTAYITTSNYFSKILNINRYIFPNKLSAQAIAKLTTLPQATTIKEFPFGDFILVSLFVKNPQLKELSKINSEDFVIIGTQKEKFIFLNNNDTLEENDLIYIFGHKEKISQILPKLDTITPTNIQNILIYSASELGIEIANILYELGFNIKILEKDEQKAQKAANKLHEDITIINSSYDDEDVFENEGLQYSDIAITASLKDEENITKSLQAKQFGIKKIITINNNLNYYSIANSLKLATIRGPKIATYYEILETIDSLDLIYERFFLGANGKIFIKKVLNPKNITPPKEYTKTLIIRDEKIYTLDEKFETQENDIVIEFNFSGNKRWIEQV